MQTSLEIHKKIKTHEKKSLPIKKLNAFCNLEYVFEIHELKHTLKIF